MEAAMTETPVGSKPFPAGSNLLVRTSEDGKSEVRSPKDGFLRCGRYEFQDVDDLSSWLSEIFSVKAQGRGARGSIKRVGKYRRVNQEGDACFTFGDPVLDQITDEHGVMVLSGRTLDLRRDELSQPDQRSGGISTIDLSPFVDDIRRSQLLDAVTGRNQLTLVECTQERIVVGSSNPSVIWIYDPSNASTKMRFRAFKKSYVLYAKMGADIETWGRDFSSASISSSYGVFLGSFCQAVHWDSDSDSNDDYVDEYEWSVGIPAQTPDGVRSRCTARWGGSTYAETVEKGCIVAEG
jgi:hypothetical protein